MLYFGLALFSFAYGFQAEFFTEQDLEKLKIKDDDKDHVRLSREFETHGTINQYVDHFSNNKRIWQQRYWYTTRFQNKSADPPIAFLLVHKENIAYLSSGNHSFVIYAEKFGAAIFDLEMRFYGPYEYTPTGEAHIDSLKYLTPEQTIEDIRKFINTMNTRLYRRNDVRWILVGIGDGGTIAAWCRAKYPKLTIGAYISSAPVAHHANYYELMLNTERIFREVGGDSCVKDIREGFDRLKTIMYSGKEGRATLFNNTIRLCEGQFNEDQLINSFQLIFSQIATFLGDSALSYENMERHSLPIQPICNAVKNKHEEILLEITSIYYMQPSFKRCLEVDYGQYVLTFDNDWDYLGAGRRSRLWEQCNGFGLFPTSDGAGDMYGSIVPLEFYNNLCMNVFGPEYDIVHLMKSEERLRDVYGTPKTYNGTNVIFTHGTLDLYKDVAFPIKYANEANNIRVIEIQDGSYCRDIYSISPDEEWLQEARDEIEKFLEKLIHATNRNNAHSIGFIWTLILSLIFAQ